MNAYVGDLSLQSVVLRLSLSVVCSALLGMERTHKLRVAGLRTFILIGIGACVAMMTGIYVHEYNPAENATRIAAQVINGISFVATGTIVVTGTSQVKGLTTAAALWANAAICLAAGAGLYSVTLIGMVLVFLCLTVIARFQESMMNKDQRIRIFTVLDSEDDFKKIFAMIREKEWKVAEFETKKIIGDITGLSIILDLPKGVSRTEAVETLDQCGHCLFSEEN